MTTNNQNCSNCRFFRPDYTEETVIYGTCRRVPPTLAKKVPDDNLTVVDGRYEFDPTYWIQPVVSDGDWCGEFQPEQMPETQQ